MTFILDTNILIEPEKVHYKIERCPGYWDWLLELAEKSQIALIDPIHPELLAGEEKSPHLAKWAKKNKDVFLPVSNKTLQSHYQDVVNYAKKTESNYNRGAYRDFTRGADPWVIAYALFIKGRIVTGETFKILGSKRGKQKIQIPNLASYFGVECMSFPRFLDEVDLKPHFVYQRLPEQEQLELPLEDC
jgi:hypothetical protein